MLVSCRDPLFGNRGWGVATQFNQISRNLLGQNPSELPLGIIDPGCIENDRRAETQMLSGAADQLMVNGVRFTR